MLIDVILGPTEIHPVVHELSVLVEASEEFSTRLFAQAYHHPDMPEALICLVQTGFNESFWKVFVKPLSVRWPHFMPLLRTLTTGHFRANMVSIPGDFKDHPPPLPLGRYANTNRRTPQKDNKDKTHTGSVDELDPYPPASSRGFFQTVPCNED